MLELAAGVVFASLRVAERVCTRVSGVSNQSVDLQLAACFEAP